MCGRCRHRDHASSRRRAKNHSLPLRLEGQTLMPGVSQNKECAKFFSHTNFRGLFPMPNATASPPKTSRPRSNKTHQSSSLSLRIYLDGTTMSSSESASAPSLATEKPRIRISIPKPSAVQPTPLRQSNDQHHEVSPTPLRHTNDSKPTATVTTRPSSQTKDEIPSDLSPKVLSGLRNGDLEFPINEECKCRQFECIIAEHQELSPKTASSLFLLSPRYFTQDYS